MTATTDSSPPAEQLYRLGAVQAALRAAGFDVHRDAVNRVTEVVLELDTRSHHQWQDRRWTKDQIDLVVAAFEMQRDQSLTWDGVAAAMAEIERTIDASPTLEDLEAEIAQLTAHCHRLSDIAAQIRSQQPTVGSTHGGGVAA